MNRFCLLVCLLLSFSFSALADVTFMETFASPSIKHMIVYPSSSPNTPQTYTGDNGFRWTYWLGGGNHECFPNDSCMYIRARRGNETCDYGYFETADPIYGGLKSLSFQWKQGGAEGDINYDIAILVNDSLVGRIQHQGLSPYSAKDSLPYFYELNDLNIPGIFTLKIENRTPYTENNNKGRFVFDSLQFTIMGDTSVSMVCGYVKDQNSQPIADVVMSDGFSVVKTDSKGYYEFPVNQYSEFVFVSVPSGFDIPVNAKGATQMYQGVAPKGIQVRNFTLNRQADGGKADTTHVMLVISDPQVLNNYDIWRYKQESIKDMKALIESYPAGTKIYTSIVGDIVWDYYTAFDSQKSSMASLGVPCFMTIGNHDHQASHACVETDQDRVADDLFTNAFGPHYYSYNIGAIHYISIDNVLYTGCGGSKDYSNAITQEQMDWLKKDVDMLPNGTPIVFFCHIPMYNVGQLETVKNYLNKGNVVQYIISGHTHTNYTHKHSARLWELNLGAVEGAFWCSNWCSNGAPNGYEVLQAGPKGYTDFYYKATGYDRDYQFSAFAPGSIDAGNSKSNCVLVNVWGYDEKWSVNIYENGVKSVMRQFTGVDPRTYDVMLADGDTRPNYPGSDGGTIASKNPGSSATKQMFYYTPNDSTAEFIVEVTDRFGHVYRRPVLRNMMVASFTQDKQSEWVYDQNFNTLASYPNQLVSSSQLAKGTFVQGHYPEGWYATTSGSGSTYKTFNYYRINTGSQADAGLYSYGAGDPTKATANLTQRSIGMLPNSSNKSMAMGVLLENNTGQQITSLSISYLGKIWRVGASATAKETLQFAWLKNPPTAALRERKQWLGALSMRDYQALSFTTPDNLQVSGTKTAVDGDNANNQTLVSDTLRVKLQPGETLLLRWTNTYDNGNEQGMAIDDLQIRAITEPTSLTHVGIEPMDDVKKIYRDGQLLILRNGHTYNTQGLRLQTLNSKL